MLPFPSLSEETVRQRATAASWQRGVNYFESGAVLNAVWREGTLTAQVEGSEIEPYRVHVGFDEQGTIREAFCSCPYEGSGDCKHIIATLLVLIHRPEEVSVRPGLRTLLEGQSREQLLALLLFLAERHPHIAETIEDFVAPPTVSAGESPAEIDLGRLQAQIKAAVREIGRNAYAAYEEAYEEWPLISEALNPAIEQAVSFLEQGKPRTALLVLEAATNAWIEGCGRLDPDFLEDSAAMEETNLMDFAQIWTEALLSADLSARERRVWERKLETWMETMISGDVLAMPLTAVRQGWDYPPLVAAMQGNFDQHGAWEDEAPDFADELAQVRLRILKARGRYEEAINLAEAEGQIPSYLQLLVEVGRSEQAVREACQMLQDPTEVLTLARTLLEHGEIDLSFEMAARGLTLGETHRRASLAEWLRDQAENHGRHDLARQAAWEALKAHPTMENYRWLKSHLGEAWETHRLQALEILAGRSSYAPGEITEIYLLEQMYPQAMALVEQYPWSGKLEKVIQIVGDEFPDWAFTQCYRQAASIMDSGRSSHYDVAIAWLRQGRDILLRAGQAERWRAVLQELLYMHQRKYKLRPMLEALRR
jgi:uncharacterized Zn finger protein